MRRIISWSSFIFLLHPKSAMIMVFLLFETHYFAIAQNKKSKIDEINITSRFKPSIVKTGKLEFYPEVPLKDTNAFNFNYIFEAISFKTPLSSFSLKPLAYQAPEGVLDVNNTFLKIGGGNLNTPFLSAAYQHRFDKNLFSFAADHISSKGQFPNQQYANSKLLGKFTRKIADNQFYTVNLGYSRDEYRNYGYDTAKFRFTNDELKQTYNRFSLIANYDLVSGSNSRLFLKPTLKFDFLTTRRGVNEANVHLDVPVHYEVSNNVNINAAFNVDYTNLNSTSAINNSISLFQLPVKVAYLVDGLYASGGIISVLKNNKIIFAPDAKLVYTFKEGSSFRILGGISNTFNVNALQKLYQINPFLLTPDQLTIYQQTNYYAGFDWLNAKGLQLRSKLGLVKFKNLPLFINSISNEQILSGKDFLVLYEESANAFFIESSLAYIFSDKLSFATAFNAYSFQSQKTYDDPYGFLPIELNMNLKWNPFSPLIFKLNGQVFGGNMALEAVNKRTKTKGILDLGFAVDYKLNKKWGFWIDLNNIANTKYQRWNGYTSFGFNFLLGVRFNFIQLAQ